MHTIQTSKLGESYSYVRHESGLDVFIINKKGFSKYYATFATKYGSIDNEFIVDGQKVSVPMGIAHFLEHKLFENEQENVMYKFGLLGAQDNAYTSFDKTAYLFSCTDRFYESLKVLLEFVTHPYFTEESVQKEQGIIAQEIKMYNDAPDWCVYFNMLKGMFVNHPVRIDIAGTVESIAGITHEKLYTCYNAFYSLTNMVLCVVGDVDAQKVLSMCDELLHKGEEKKIERIYPEEPNRVCEKRIVKQMPVSMPLFYMGIKERNTSVSGYDMVMRNVATDIILALLVGESSELYNELYTKGLINANFGYEYSSGASYGMSVFGGESPDPDAVYDMIIKGFERLKTAGLEPSAFERTKKMLYGSFVKRFNSLERLANYFLNCYNLGMQPYDYIKAFEEITLEDVKTRLGEHFLEESCVLSIVKA